jgi:hypothetical protein
MDAPSATEDFVNNPAGDSLVPGPKSIPAPQMDPAKTSLATDDNDAEAELAREVELLRADIAAVTPAESAPFVTETPPETPIALIEETTMDELTEPVVM